MNRTEENIPFPVACFVRLLAEAEPGAGRTNPWAGETLEATLRRQRLIAHLSGVTPSVILVASQGRAVDVGATGVSLCSEHVVRAGLVPAVSIAAAGSSTNVEQDRLASDVWGALALSNSARETICFPVVPFPSADGHGMLVTRNDATRHAKFLRSLIMWHEGVRIVAVGEQSHHLLGGLNIEHERMQNGDTQSRGWRRQLAALVDRIERLPLAASVL